MADGVDSVAVTALVIALIALITAIGQLLQAFLATADGYRRCQSSVMGDWAKKIRLRWRWSQFRFGTLYTTPEICMIRDSVAEDGRILILGDQTSRRLTVTPRDGLAIPLSNPRQRKLEKALIRKKVFKVGPPPESAPQPVL
jgi:hypothetical protein